MTTLGGDDHDVVIILGVHKRGRADAALRADEVEQQHSRRAREPVTDQAAGDAVDPRVRADQQTQGWPRSASKRHYVHGRILERTRDR